MLQGTRGRTVARSATDPVPDEYLSAAEPLPRAYVRVDVHPAERGQQFPVIFNAATTQMLGNKVSGYAAKTGGHSISDLCVLFWGGSSERPAARKLLYPCAFPNRKHAYLVGVAH